MIIILDFVQNMEIGFQIIISRSHMIKFLVYFSLIYLISSHSHCTHDHFSANVTKHFYNDLDSANRRLLQESNEGKIRIFMDYSQVTVGGPTEINTIKRISNITASYFYNLLTVVRLQRLYFPERVEKRCNVLNIPQKYVKQGTIGDIGVVVGNQQNSEAIYVAKSSPCAFLESNKRPIWGMMQFNNAYLKYDQQGFQQIVFVGIHEMTHILGFSALMYQMYPKGNPLKTDQNGDNFLSSPSINRQVKQHFGCNNSKGLPLQDQDGTLIASHWERKVVGNQFMIASNKKGSFVSRFTLALLESSGWYTNVDYRYAEETTWGKGKGCQFLNIDNCQFDQFCSSNNFQCDWEGTVIGKCSNDPFSGSCQMVKYYTNTVCIDQNYELKNLNSKLNSLQRGGSNSKCFRSSYRETSLKASKLNNRCYISVCSYSGRYIFVLVGNYILVCRQPNQQIPAPLGLEGTLTCPSNFGNYCKNKQSCPYHCNKNGACINNQCLCTGNTQLSPSCLDISIYDAPVGSTGGLLNSLKDNQYNLILDSQLGFTDTGLSKPSITKYSINKKCFTGKVFDKLFGECLSCKDVYNCSNCDQNGCISCDNGSSPQNSKCYSR